MAHLVHRRKHHKPHSKTGMKIVDAGIYVVAFFSPIVTLPQVFQVWKSHASGDVSLITWGCYAAVSVLWVVYGLVHKEKPIVLSQILLLTTEMSIVIGVILHK